MARHIENLQIRTFRGIRDLSIEDVGDVNILVGDNNAGKTSVLEAIQLLCAPNEYNLVQIARQREKYRMPFRSGIGLLDSVLFMFDVNLCSKENNYYNIDLSAAINGNLQEVSIKGEVVEQLVNLNKIDNYFIPRNSRSYFNEEQEISSFVGEINYSYAPFLVSEQKVSFEVNDYRKLVKSKNLYPILRVRAVQTIDHIIENAFGNLIKNKSVKEQAVTLLKEFDSTITDIRYINDDKRYIPVIENTIGEYVPLQLYGDGIKKALTMLNAMVNTKDGVVLIDEFETALHTSAMKRVFKFLLDIAEQLNIQLFLTTHSIEAVDKLLESAEINIDKIRIVRLKKKDKTTFAKVIDGNTALNDRKEYNMELRI